jgi:CBS domain containing-hemolysin-like protein
MVPLSEYAVVDETATLTEALEALRASQVKLPPDRQPHRAILVRDGRGEIVGKVHYFAFLRALAPERGAMAERGVMDRAGVDEDMLASSMHMLDFLTADLVDLCVRARNVVVRDVCARTSAGIDEGLPLHDAISRFLAHQTLSLLVTRGGRTIGILRLSDLFDELSRQILEEAC